MVSALIFILLSFGLFGVFIYLFISSGIWLRISHPFLLLLVGYTGVMTVKYFVTETGKKKVEGESAESNRQLGLTYQGQGMLDMAFEKFRKLPMDDDLKGIIYNLALDYERKRQFNKAAVVLEHIESYDSGYKDVKDRKKKLMQASETMVFGESPFAVSTSDPLLATGTGTRPTLGRYEVLKALGKGAMGIVYLGEDPRIRRPCAIKTIRFDEDYSPEEEKEAKTRFFREAESAGTLSHPNIVTIYDAGEEQDLAYIAMEYLDGRDLEVYTKPERLLPWRKVMGYVIDIAEALNYAHQKGIVHRDIKPANVMLLSTGVIKITDFGIARITATSKTQTGVVKGSPYYMSPEQFQGEKVDGRSDIFSLGTMMFQLLTGHLPFQGENPATLMHRIMNEPHPDPKIFNPGIPKYLKPIIDKALAKDREKRYQTAAQMASDLRALAEKIDAAMERRQLNNGTAPKKKPAKSAGGKDK